ncbi:MAG: C25 family cysteine peptidase [Acidobacteriota bacterium]
MKKVGVFALLAILIGSTSVPLSAQRLRIPKSPPKTTVEAGAVFASASAFSDGNGVFFSWQMEVETDNAGFYIYRFGPKGAENISSSRFVPGSAMKLRSEPVYGEKYRFYDPNGDSRSTYYIEALLLDGSTVSSPMLSPAVVSDLNSAAGRSSADLQRQIKESTGNIERSTFKMSRDLGSEVVSNLAPADQAAHLNVIGQPGVKLGVNQTGLYRVTKAQLLNAGFDVNSDPANWQLFTDGIEKALNVGPNGDWVEFYGKGIDTPESDTKAYFMIAGGTSGKRFGQRTIRPGFSTVLSPNYAQTFFKKERSIYVDTAFNGDEENYFGRLIASGGTTLTFGLSGIDVSNPATTVNVKLLGFTTVAHTVQITLNGNLMGTATGQNIAPFLANFSIPTSQLIEGTNSLNLKSTGPGGDFSLFDSISIGFNRKYIATANTLEFATPNNKRAEVGGFSTANIRLFDITNESEPAAMSGLQIQQNGSSYGYEVTAGRGRLYFSVEDSALLSPAFIRGYQPTVLSDPSNRADLVIISYRDFKSQADTWAVYRRNQGFEVKVVDVESIYDEFNFGVLGSSALKNFLSSAKNNWQKTPQYVLLVGDASYDPRNYEGFGFFDLVPTRIVTTVFSEVASDEWLTDFDGDGLAEMAVGRIPARTPDTVTTMFNKVVAFEASLASPLDRGALFVFDNPVGYDFEAMSHRLRDRLPPNVPATFLARSSQNANAEVVNQINGGKYIVNYSGHGTTATWGGNPLFFTILNVPQLTNQNNQSIFTMLTCLNGYFFRADPEESLAETITKAQNGGAVAAWASTGKTTPDVQEIMGGQFYEDVGIGAIPRMGDLIRAAKTRIVGGSDVRLSWALIGDPMLKVR